MMDCRIIFIINRMKFWLACVIDTKKEKKKKKFEQSLHISIFILLIIFNFEYLIPKKHICSPFESAVAVKFILPIANWFQEW